MESNDRRETRAARNQAMFRAVNEKITVLNEAFGALTGNFAIACECADSRCITLVEIDPSDYREIRKSPRRFVVLPEHVQADVEDVVSDRGGYVVVEVIGAGVDIAEATYQREGSPPLEPRAAEATRAATRRGSSSSRDHADSP